MEALYALPRIGNLVPCDVVLCPGDFRADVWLSAGAGAEASRRAQGSTGRTCRAACQDRWGQPVTTDSQGVTIAYTNGSTITAKLVAHVRHSSTPSESVEVESNAIFRWSMLRLPAPDLQAMYEKVPDRDASRDYTKGEIDLSYVASEGLVYFANTLRFYLEHRPAIRLLAEPPADLPLGKVLNRVEPSK